MIKKPLKKLSGRHFAQDIKKYIKSSHDFHNENIPELETMAKKLHEDHSLKNFYKIFNRLWKSNLTSEHSLALHTLAFYSNEFDYGTWSFLKLKLKEIKSWDQADYVGRKIVGEILLKVPSLKREMIKLAREGDVWMKKIVLSSVYPLIEKGDYEFIFKISRLLIKNSSPQIQTSIGEIVCKISENKPGIARKFISDNRYMSQKTFDLATAHLKKRENSTNLRKNKRGFLFWRR
jgi:hypothetical protein